LRPDFIATLRRHVARTSIGPSTLRGQRTPGLVDAAREFLCELALADFLVGGKAGFAEALDGRTDEMRTSLPRGAQHWGVARKSLNIFLRNALYTGYLRDHYRLAPLEPWLELPLDSITARRICAVVVATGTQVPRWHTVRGLTPDDSRAYQDAAAQIAAAHGVDRVHLDAYWWGDRRSDGASRL